MGEVNALFLNREEHFRQAVDEVLEGAAGASRCSR